MLESKRNIGKQIATTFKVIGQTFNIALKNAQLNITIEQFIIINAIGSHENSESSVGITQNELAVMFNKDKSGILRHIESLENKDLVLRFTDETDRRKKILKLTKLGTETLRKIKEVEIKTYEKLLKNVPNQNLNILSETFEIIQKSAS
ncbi:MAG: MarR family transcriptional regulator [Bacteroidota bacterium]